MAALAVLGLPLASGALAAGAAGMEVELAAEAVSYAVVGNLGRKLGPDEDGRDGFRQQAEIEIAARWLDPGQARRWGVIYRFEAELEDGTMTPRAFGFLQDRHGELRAGIDDAPAVSMQIGAATIAVATGGIDGELVASDDLVIPRIVDNDAPRLVAYTPDASGGGWQLGASFTTGPTDEDGIDDTLDVALVRLGGDGEVGTALSLAAAIEQHGGLALQLGGLVALDELAVAGSIALDRLDEDGSGDWRRFANLGVAAELAGLDLSLTGGWCFACDERENWNVVLGAERALLPGLATGVELSRFDEAEGGRDAGTILLFSLAVAF